MKQIRKLASAVLSLTIFTTCFAGGGFAVRADAANYGRPMKLSEIMADWNTRLRDEEAKYPNNSYWNDYDSNNPYCSGTPCDHSTNQHTHCNQATTKKPINDKHEQQYGSFNSTTRRNDQCGGFAQLLAQDIWRTDEFVVYHLDTYNNKNGYINYTADGWREYEPQIGDLVRLFSASEDKQGHSIFITGMDGNRIIFAECNSRLNDCRINWRSCSALDYETGILSTVTKQYLRDHAVYIERPYIQGDFNLTGKIDRDDYKKFEDTYLSTGNPDPAISIKEYDVNGDLKVTVEDWYQMAAYMNRTKADGCICGTGGSITYQDRNFLGKNQFVYLRGIYEKLPDGKSAAFIGPFMKGEKTFSVSSYAKDYDSNNQYTVTEIGNPSERYPFGSSLRELTKIIIPQTVTTINRYAFSGDPCAIRTITFTGTPELKTIEDYAFMRCKNLTTLDLSKCTKLKRSQVHDSTFTECPNLHIIYP